MTICQRCHRPLKNPAINGLGPVCAKAAKPAQAVEPDLFGYNIDAAAQGAQERVAGFIEAKAWLAAHAIKAAFKDARERLGVRP